MYLMREETETPFIRYRPTSASATTPPLCTPTRRSRRPMETDNQMRQEVLTIRQMLYGEHER